MKTNIKAYQLIEKGLSAKTVSKLTESQINLLYNKFNLTEQVTKSTTTSYNIPTSDADKGVTLPPDAVQSGKKITVQKTQTGIKVTPSEEVTEEEEVTLDPNKDTETQDPHQVGPSTNDGFDNNDDGMYNFESIEESKKSEKNPWAICTAQLGKEFKTTERSQWSAKQNNKYERCVKDVKKSLKEGKNPVSLFLENEIMKIVEKNLPPRITKGDLVKYLSEQGPATAPTKPSPGTKPTTKPGKPSTKPRPSHPGKNPNPGENPSPKARKVSPDKAKDEVIDLIINLLDK